MPVIVDEIVISVEVSTQGAGGAGPTTDPQQDKQAIVSECVERVLDILRREQEP